ncbi:MAG: hypothetical protein WDN28_29405 [Chthoniobacter sp.]
MATVIPPTFSTPQPAAISSTWLKPLLNNAWRCRRNAQIVS